MSRLIAFSLRLTTKLTCLLVLSIIAATVGFFAPSLLAAPENACGSSGITLTSQAQVNAFDQSCEIVDGYLKITGADIVLSLIHI